MTTLASLEIEGFARTVTKPWGSELVFTPGELPYAGKILMIRAGQRLSLQLHDVKMETVLLLSGSANLQLEDADGTMHSIAMEPGRGYTVLPGRKHRLSAVTDAAIAEASTPEAGTTFRLEDDFGRPDEDLSERRR